MYRECRHILPNGTRCHAAALEKMPYCYYHDRLHRSLNGQKTAEKSKKKTLELRPLEDRASILMALSEVICGLAAGRVDSSDAGRLIYGLQVAGQYAERNAHSAPDNAVESLTCSEDGHELAPEQFHCFESDDCDDCPYRGECDGKEVDEDNDDDDDSNED